MLYGDNETQETITALEEKEVPAVAVSLSQLENLHLGPQELALRSFEGVGTKVPFLDRDQFKKSAALSPAYPMTTPYDQWRVYNTAQEGGIFPKCKIYEERFRVVNSAEWMPYILTTFLQNEPGAFLEYLRLIMSTINNPWVAPYFQGENPGEKFFYVDMIGNKYSVSQGYAPIVMYPHVIKSNGDIDFSITLDRFIETVVWYALDRTFTVLDLSRTTDVKLLERAHDAILNRSKYIKSQVSEPSIVNLIKDGRTYKTIAVTIHPDMQEWMKIAIERFLLLIRQNIEKLAARVIELKALEAQGITAEFIGPQWLNPLTPSKFTDEQIAAQMKLLPVITQKPQYNLPTSLKQEYYHEPPVDNQPTQNGGTMPKKQTNFLLPIAGAAAAALGIYAATR